MLIASFVLTVLTLALVFSSVRSREKPFSPVICTIVVSLFIGSYGGMLLLYPHLLAALGLGVLAISCLALSHRPRGFVVGGLVVCLAAYLICVAYVVQEMQRLREKFPVVSMAERVRPPQQQVEPLAGQVEWLPEPRSNWRSDWRHDFYERLHANQLEFFVNQPGFGTMRMHSSQMQSYLEQIEEVAPIPQNETYPARLFATKDEGKRNPHDLLKDSHEKFFDPNEFGLFRDRDRVTGFVPHRFKKRPASLIGYRLLRVDLLGLVVAEEPRVYVSENLPRMQDLRHGPTREPDAFEAEALAQLRKGDLFSSREPDDGELRILGAIRSEERCNACHAAQTGDLLGAFSYRLHRER